MALKRRLDNLSLERIDLPFQASIGNQALLNPLGRDTRQVLQPKFIHELVVTMHLVNDLRISFSTILP